MPLPPTADPAPYPEIAVCGQDCRYVELLSKSFASRRGELTAITRYCYQSWMLQKTTPELSHLLIRIAMVEMKHLDILGQLILLLGGEPRYYVPSPPGCVPWNGGMVDYTSRSLAQMLRNNIEAERFSCRTYRVHGGQIRDEKVSAMLRRLALDEQLHIRLFEDALSAFCLPPS